MKKFILLATILYFSSAKIFSQTVLLSEDRSRDSIPETFGPNLKNYAHIIIGYSFVFGESGKEFPVMGGSNEFHVGVRVKRKVTPVYSFGYDIFYRAMEYYISQNADKKFPDTLTHKSQKFNFFSFGAGLYNRFNFDPNRGNFLGTYADIGITGEWDFTARTVTNDVLPDDEKIRVVAKHFDYVNYFSSRIFVRGGRSRLLVYGTFRITNHFKTSSEIPEAPRFTAGVELNIF